ncbi:hypothetical protein CC1G_08313 [Coprinopsis cinerea okayama7|uniref:Chromatin modification-related protein n=1 Tax=Coprinopsis cinerea (strain Okayama-7 / 130 / ATCC MYA-4618 / FGSC 9003) TaxID=240176 RepID=A8PG84_COPC7|nr:hypothetical protein CC1G_08313 [Coprinopsis cinerea okayama7\|eukprot:XP_001841169.1 hypothetical protein CC1G_08313 [Coprinopsis cinerea okayama7\
MAASSTALEEAAYIASEFIYSIDNLPNEVAHILAEIKHKDTRTQELQNEIDKDSARYIRHSLRATATPLQTPTPNARAPSPKSAAIPGKISAAYEEIQVLAGEKAELAQKLIEIIQRTRTRLDVELNKVRVLQGEPVDFLATPGKPAASNDALKNPALAVTESLRNALASTPLSQAPSPQASAGTTSVAGSSANKRRKVAAAASPSIKIPTRSASPTVQAPAAQASHQRSRLSRQVHPPVQDEDEDMDAEGDEDVGEEGDDGDGDDRLYCYCQKQSYGDMIACDNEGECPYEWFHLTCVNIKGPTPERWYCDYCKDKIPQSTRKGRKK